MVDNRKMIYKILESKDISEDAKMLILNSVSNTDSIVTLDFDCYSSYGVYTLSSCISDSNSTLDNDKKVTIRLLDNKEEIVTCITLGRGCAYITKDREYCGEESTPIDYIMISTNPKDGDLVYAKLHLQYNDNEEIDNPDYFNTVFTTVFMENGKFVGSSNFYNEDTSYVIYNPKNAKKSFKTLISNDPLEYGILPDEEPKNIDTLDITELLHDINANDYAYNLTMKPLK